MPAGILRSERPVDLRRAVIRALAGGGGVEAAAALAELHAAYRVERLEGASLDVGFLAAECLTALARLRDLEDAELASWMAEPHGRAEEDLLVRLPLREGRCPRDRRLS